MDSILLGLGVMVMVLNATFNNISVISWSVLLVEKTGVPGENHRPRSKSLKILSYNVVSSASRHESDSNSQVVIDNYNYHAIMSTMAPGWYLQLYFGSSWLLCLNNDFRWPCLLSKLYLIDGQGHWLSYIDLRWYTWQILCQRPLQQRYTVSYMWRSALYSSHVENTCMHDSRMSLTGKVCVEKRTKHPSPHFYRSIWKYQRGNQNPLMEEGQTTQWTKEKGQTTKHYT